MTETAGNRHSMMYGARLFLLCCWLLSYGPVHAQPIQPPSSNPILICVMEDRFYFSAEDDIHGRELWCCQVSDSGPPQCYLVIDLVPGRESSDPVNVAGIGDRIYFSARTPERGLEPWYLEHAGDTVHLIKDFVPGPESSLPRFIGYNANALYIMADSKEWGRELWSSNLDTTGLQRLSDINTGPDSGIRGDFGKVLPDGSLLFRGWTYLWRSDATPEGTALLTFKDRELPAHAEFFQPLQQGVIFSAFDNTHGFEPWFSDGTEEGTHCIKNICPGSSNAKIYSYFIHRDIAYFTPDDSVHGFELWRSDGTSEGTYLLKDIAPGPTGSNPHYFSGSDALIFFVADNGVHGQELWCSDGTSDGTRMVVDMTPGPSGTTIWSTCGANDRVYICAGTLDHGEEVYVSDGTAAGTHVLKDIIPGPDSQGPGHLVILKDTLFFNYNDPFYGDEYWVSDGTEAGTRLLKDIWPPRSNPSSSPHRLVAGSDRLFFVVGDRAHGEEVWSSQGTTHSTRLLADIASGPQDAYPEALTPAGDKLFFTAKTVNAGRELWICDTAADTAPLLCDIRPGFAGSFPEQLLWHDGMLYFTADDGTHGRELWQSDGTQAGTVLTADHTIDGSTDFTRLFAHENTIYGYTHAEAEGIRLYRCIPSPMTLLHQLTSPELYQLSTRITPATGSQSSEDFLLFTLYPPFLSRNSDPASTSKHSAFIRLPTTQTLFVARDNQHGAELWKTDGTIPGTKRVHDIFPGAGSASPKCLTRMGAWVYFVAESPEFGQVLWRSDGTRDNTVMIRPLSNDMSHAPVIIFDMEALNNTLITAARDPLDRADSQKDDVELYLIHCEEELAFRIEKVDIREGTAGSWPADITRVGDTVYFTADDGIHGRELWACDGTRDSVRLLKDFRPPSDLSPSVRTGYTTPR